MLKAREHDLAFSRSIFALLAYYGSGNVQTFFSIVDRALTYAKVSIKEGQIASAKRLLYNHLLLFGVLESSEIHGQRRWSFGPNRLVKLPGGSILPLGDGSFASFVSDRLSEDNASPHVFYTFPSYIGPLRLCAPKFNAAGEDLERLGREFNCRIYGLNGRKLTELLPPVEEVYRSLVNPGIDPNQIDVSTELKRFDDSTGEWNDTSARELTPGLYRIPHVFGHHRDIVIKKGANSLVGFDITSRDWSLILSAYLLGKKLKWSYVTRQQVISIPAWQMASLPMLVKRVLCAGTMRWPGLVDRRYLFDEVEPHVTSLLTVRYPMIGIKHV